MSADFSLGGGGFDAADWRRRCVELFETGGWVVIGGFEGDEPLIHGDVPTFERDEFNLMTTGGTRGVRFEQEADGGYEIRMALLSSKGDWYLLHSLLLMGVQAGGEARYLDHDEVLGGEQLTEEASLARWQPWWDMSVGTVNSIMEADASPASIPTPVGTVTLTPELLSMGAEPLHDWLVAWCDKYATAFRASLLTVEPPSGGEVMLSVYSGMNTIVSKKAQFVTLGQIELEGWVPLEQMVQAVDGSEEFEDYYFIPGVDFSELPEILEQIKALQVDPATVEGSPSGAASGDGGELTEEDAEILSRAPVLVFLLVAAADGNIDKKEVRAFQKCCEMALENPDGSLLRMAISVAATRLEEMLALCSQSDPGEQLAQIRDLLETKLDVDSAFAFKGGLLMLGHQIANASGGGLLGKIGLGKKIDASEQAALAALIMILDIDIERLGQFMNER